MLDNKSNLENILADKDNRPAWLDAAFEEAWARASKTIKAGKAHQGYDKYKNDPVKFVEELLGETMHDELKQIAYSVRDNPITVAKSSTDVGKTWLAARLGIWFFNSFPGSKVFIAAAPPLENLKQIMWDEITAVNKKKPTLFSSCRIKNLMITRGPKSFIQGLAIPTSGTAAEREAKFSGKHAPYLFFIVDEGDAVPDEIYKGIEGCMSGGEMVRLLIMFNPRQTSGRVYELEKTRQANVIQLSAFSHPNVITGDNLIPGAVTRDTTLRRINTWTRPLLLNENPDGDCFDVPEYLLGIPCTGLDGKLYPPIEDSTRLRKITEPSFAYMVLGRYPSQSTAQLISEVWVDAAISRWKLYVAKYGENPPEGVKPVMSLDMAEYGTDYCVAFLRYGGYVSKPSLWTGVDPDVSATKAIEIYIKSGADIVMVDGTGIGAGVAPSMARQGRPNGLRAISVKVSERPSPVIKSDLGDFKILRDQIWWAMREWFKSDQAMIPPDGLLREELLAVDYEVKNGKILVTPKDELRRRLKRSPDRGDALALTFSPFERPRWTRIDSINNRDIVYNDREQYLGTQPVYLDNDATSPDYQGQFANY